MIGEERASRGHGWPRQERPGIGLGRRTRRHRSAAAPDQTPIALAPAMLDFRTLMTWTLAAPTFLAYRVGCGLVSARCSRLPLRVPVRARVARSVRPAIVSRVRMGTLRPPTSRYLSGGELDAGARDAWLVREDLHVPGTRASGAVETCDDWFGDVARLAQGRVDFREGLDDTLRRPSTTARTRPDARSAPHFSTLDLAGHCCRSHRISTSLYSLDGCPGTMSGRCGIDRERRFKGVHRTQADARTVLSTQNGKANTPSGLAADQTTSRKVWVLAPFLALRRRPSPPLLDHDSDSSPARLQSESLRESRSGGDGRRRHAEERCEHRHLAAVVLVGGIPDGVSALSRVRTVRVSLRSMTPLKRRSRPCRIAHSITGFLL